MERSNARVVVGTGASPEVWNHSFNQRRRSRSRHIQYTRLPATFRSVLRLLIHIIGTKIPNMLHLHLFILNILPCLLHHMPSRARAIIWSTNHEICSRANPFESASDLLLPLISTVVTSEGKRRHPSLKSATKDLKSKTPSTM